MTGLSLIYIYFFIHKSDAKIKLLKKKEFVQAILYGMCKLDHVELEKECLVLLHLAGDWKMVIIPYPVQGVLDILLAMKGLELIRFVNTHQFLIIQKR